MTTATVKRNDFKTRARVTLNCPTCGTLTVRCDLANADIYEEGFKAHVCGPLSQQAAIPAVARMLRHMAGGDR